MDTNYIQISNVHLTPRVEGYLNKILHAFGTDITKEGKVNIKHLRPSETFELLRELKSLGLY